MSGAAPVTALPAAASPTFIAATQAPSPAGWIGWNAPQPPQVLPFASQSANAAFAAIIAPQPRAASALNVSDRSALSASAISEAITSPAANARTYAALDLVRRWATDGGDAQLLMLERLARAALVRRLHGNPATSVALLEENIRALETRDGELDAAELGKPATRMIYLQSRMGQLDAALQNASEKTGYARKAAYAEAKRLLGEINYFVHEGEASSSRRGAEKSLASELHAFAIAQMMRDGYPLSAYQTAADLFASYGSTPAAERMRSPDSPISFFLDDDGKLKELGRGRHLEAALKEAARHATHSNKLEFWAESSAGAAAFVLMGALSGVTDYSVLSELSGIGATLASGAGRVANALTSGEVQEALATGYSGTSPMQAAISGAARLGALGATYLAYGGAAPGLPYLSDVPVLGGLIAAQDGNSAQLYGPGSIIAGLGSAGAHHIGLAADVINRHGLAQGLPLAWEGYSGATTFGSGINAFLAADARFIHWAQGALQNGIDFGSHELSARDALTALEAVSGAYAFATMVRPELRNRLLAANSTLTRIAELALMPGGYLLARDLGLALGVAPRDAHIIPFLAWAFQARDQIMGGIRPAHWDFSNFIRNPFVELAYAGVGAQMMQGALPPHGFTDLFGASMAIQVGLIPVGALHGALLGYEQVRFWHNKFWRSFSAETFGNLMRITLGWSTWYGTLASQAAQTFVQCPWMTRVAQEPVNGASQRAALRGLMRDDGQSAARALETQAAQAGRRWRFLTPITGTTLTENLSPFLAFVFTTTGKDEPFETIPEERYFMMVSGMLSQGGRKAIPAADAVNYLGLLDRIVSDTSIGRRDARRGLLIATWAARGGIHGAEIKKFFAERDWLFDHYNIPRRMGTAPAGWKRARWFRGLLKE